MNDSSLFTVFSEQVMPTPFPKTLPTVDLKLDHPLSQKTLQRIARAVREFALDREPKLVTLDGKEYRVIDIEVRSVARATRRD